MVEPQLTRESLVPLEQDVIRSVALRLIPHLPLVRKGGALSWNHYLRELLIEPMNYWRCLETPLILRLLQPTTDDIMLDIGSPKLLSLYLALKGHRTFATDIWDSFAAEVRNVKGLLAAQQLELGVLDGRLIPLRDASVDKAYALSVIEHIPGDGDTRLMAEIERVLRPGGLFCITTPFWHDYLEEYRGSVPWAQFSDASGTFYQRRYSNTAVRERLQANGLLLEEPIYMAERPITQGCGPQPDGSFRENVNLLAERVTWLRLLRKFPVVPGIQLPVPLLHYFAASHFSQKYHYLTADPTDNNVRGVCLLFRKQ